MADELNKKPKPVESSAPAPKQPSQPKQATPTPKVSAPKAPVQKMQEPKAPKISANSKTSDPVRQKIMNQGFAPTLEQRNAAFDKFNRSIMQKHGKSAEGFNGFKKPELLSSYGIEGNGWSIPNKYPDNLGDHEIGQQDDGSYYHEYIRPWKKGEPNNPRERKQRDENLSEADVEKLFDDFYKEPEYEIDPKTGEKYVDDITLSNMDYVFNYPDKNYDTLRGQELDDRKGFDALVKGMVDRFGRRYKDGNQYDWTNIYRDAARRAMKKRGLNVDDEYYQDDGWDY